MTRQTVDVPGLGPMSVRDPLPEDRNFVAGSVWHALRRLHDHLPARRLTDLMDRAMDVWDLPSAPLRLVMTPPDDSWVIVAFMAGDPVPPRLDHLHVHPRFRGLGIGREMYRLLLGPDRPLDHPCAVSTGTPDLLRERHDGRFPDGLLRNPRYRLHLVGYDGKGLVRYDEKGTR